KPFVETETRDFRARGFGSLKERIVIGYFDLCAVNLDLCHRLSKPAACAASSRSQTLVPALTGLPGRLTQLIQPLPDGYCGSERRCGYNRQCAFQFPDGNCGS